MSTLKVNNLQDLGADAVVTNGVVARGALPSGSVLQVVQTVKSNGFTTSSASFTDVTGLSATITPNFTTSKILIIVSVTVSNDTGGRGAHVQLVGGGAGAAVGDSNGSRVRSLMSASYNSYGVGPTSATYLDSPATTSAITYKLQLRRGDAGTGNIGYSATGDSGDNGSHISTITLMEIAG